ncbi:MAG TPA: heterodisulfide reductase-related iron-sulfur binding cluster [Blastocatellia bacterium]|nr:heterodisulfide reductase-related iron-sulfur binding cluster [Blastocatellia bacterium]
MSIEQQPSVLASLLNANTEKLLTCVHCGLCLPSCPTYRVLGNENDSPRGRIYLMRGVVEGRLNIGATFTSHIDACLGCRACESACPSSVPYGHLLEAARAEVSQTKLAQGVVSERVVRFVLNQTFTRPRVLRIGMALARLLRDSGLAQLAFETKLVSGRFRLALALLLATRSRLAARASQRYASKAGDGPRTAMRRGALRVGVLRGCVMEGLFEETNRATERVLVRNGFELVNADKQMCCGALHAHAGQLERARQLARRNIEAFLESGCDRVIVNAAGCGSAMKEYGQLLGEDPEFEKRALEFSAKVRDVFEFLAEEGLEPPKTPLMRRVAYDAPCHLIHAQRIAQAPMELMKQIPGIMLIPLRGFESCCGGAGIYNLQHPALSGDILRDKLEAVTESGVDTLATGNPGCIMQIGAGLLLTGSTVDVVHPIDLLDAACAEPER